MLEHDPSDQSALYHLVIALRKTNETGEISGLTPEQTRQGAAGCGKARGRTQPLQAGSFSLRGTEIDVAGAQVAGW